METIHTLVEEQQAISFIVLGFLSLALAFSIGQYAVAGKAYMRQAFWSAQILLAFAGACILLLPTASFALVSAVILLSAVLLLRLQRAHFHEQQFLLPR